MQRPRWHLPFYHPLHSTTEDGQNILLCPAATAGRCSSQLRKSTQPSTQSPALCPRREDSVPSSAQHLQCKEILVASVAVPLPAAEQPPMRNRGEKRCICLHVSSHWIYLLFFFFHEWLLFLPGHFLPKAAEEKRNKIIWVLAKVSLCYLRSHKHLPFSSFSLLKQTIKHNPPGKVIHHKISLSNQHVQEDFCPLIITGSTEVASNTPSQCKWTRQEITRSPIAPHLMGSLIPWSQCRG